MFSGYERKDGRVPQVHFLGCIKTTDITVILGMVSIRQKDRIPAHRKSHAYLKRTPLAVCKYAKKEPFLRALMVVYQKSY